MSDPKPRSFDSLHDAMRAVREDAQPQTWVRPPEPASKEQRANDARRQAQRLIAALGQPTDDSK